MYVYVYIVVLLEAFSPTFCKSSKLKCFSLSHIFIKNLEIQNYEISKIWSGVPTFFFAGVGLSLSWVSSCVHQPEHWSGLDAFGIKVKVLNRKLLREELISTGQQLVNE